MSGLGAIPNIVVPQVQTPNYQGIGALIAQSGVNPAAFGQNLAQGLEKGAQIGQEQQKIGILQQQADQQKQMDDMKIAEQKQKFMGDMAYGISKLPEDKQEGAYKKVVGGLMQQGILKEPPPMWSDGGKDLVDQLKVQSPQYAQEQKNQLEMIKMKGDMELQGARIGLVNAQTRGQEVKNSMGPQAKPLSAEGAKIAGLAQSGLTGLDNLQTLLSTATTGDLASGQYVPTALQGQKAQDYDRLRTQVSETLGRLNSGGAINKDEEARFLKMMPKWSDTPETKQAKIDSLRTQIGTVQKSMGIGGSSSQQDSGYAAAHSQYPGLTEQQYAALMRGK